MEPVRIEGVQLFGLERATNSGLKYLTLDEGLERGIVHVTEISDAGSVPRLQVRNKGNDLLFLMSGEQLMGGKQNRVLNVSVVIDANTEAAIPVSCVEGGRWRYTSRKFGSPGTASHSFLRAQMLGQVSESYRQTGEPASNQGDVWTEILRKLGKMGSRSQSSALNKVYEDHVSRLLKFAKNLEVPAGAAGVVFVFNGRIMGMDLFDQASTLEKLWPKLVRSYAIDAIEEPAQSSEVSRKEIAGWLSTALTATSETFQSPGLGDAVRFESETVTGASLLLGDEPVHTEMYRA
jgi:hypothetical protein